MTVKITINLPEETVRAIKQIASERQISQTEALRQMVDNQRFLYGEIKNGGKVLIRRPNETAVAEVIFPETKTATAKA